MRSKLKQQQAQARFKLANPDYFKEYHAHHGPQAARITAYSIKPTEVFALLVSWEIVGNVPRLTNSGRRAVLASARRQ